MNESPIADLDGTQGPTLLRFSGKQRALYDALAERDSRLAAYYYGALAVLFDSHNPDRHSLAAHGLRELLEKLPRYLDLPGRIEGPRLNEKVQELRQAWKTARERSSCLCEETPSDRVDGALRQFLKRVQSFFGWLEEHRPSRKQGVRKILASLDPSPHQMPQVLADLRVREWDEIREFFEGVAHHKPVPDSEFLPWLDSLETFILDRVRPRTFADYERIDNIIAEGEKE